MRGLVLILCVTGCSASTPLLRYDEEAARQPWITLWSATQNSDAVIVADVASVHRDVPLLGTSATVATLAVVDALKGETTGALEVSRRNYQLCGIASRPAQLLQGYRAVAFTSRSAAEGWHPNNLRYPSSPDDLADIVALVRLAGAERRARHASREWIIEALMRRGTRADGLVELERAGLRLTDEELQALEKAFIARPSVDQVLVPFVREVLGDRRSEGVDLAMANAIETMIAGGQNEELITRAVDLIERRLTCARTAPCGEVEKGGISLDPSRVLWRRPPSRRTDGPTLLSRWDDLKGRWHLQPVADARVRLWHSLAFAPPVSEEAD